MRRLMTFAMLAFFLGAFIFGLNAYAWKAIDWPISPTGSYTSREVIEGKIKSIDLEKMEIRLEECELLGDASLMFTKDTTCYMGDEKTNIVSIRGGTKFHEKDILSFSHLKAGDYIKCNYSIKDGKFWAVRVVHVAPYLSVE
ncbi:MAG: hypothetical protein SCARUB_04388 [Candidatus Scalindua rubra]|uniref:DUF5666 domain-containing protein n=1 Tax=Candidatus Scalindua rubra TaxID=1872076 RepID=A0A1E3X4E8_9BACT|nr:MAG: hypothetical protein SCARUB_04388 [Candidatus Scalindua rubra]